MPRERRQAVQTNAAMYVGYADDDEDVDSIMKKFKALEEVAEAKRSAGAADLSEEDLVKAVGLRVGCGVDYSMDADRAGAGGASGSRHRGPKGEHVQTGEVQIVPAHVAPEELDAADAADAKRRLKAGPDYLPPAQRRDEQVTMPSLVPLELNKDVVMVELEGIDAACREAAFAAMPASVAEDERHAFLDALTRELRLMAARGTPKEERTLEKAAHEVAETIEKASNVDAPNDGGVSTMAPDAARRCAAALARAAARDSKSGSKSALRVRSKGTGLICVRPGGIAPNTYLGAYCGELYPGWRWYEKEAAAQAVRRDVRVSLDEVPVFYNAAVERDGDDPRGYDVLFIDGALKGSILTRASHSCAPNAAMRVRVRDGAYAVEMASVERVRVGDEICWDYRCRTDSEREMRAALCLCGSRRCRVSYLHFAGHDDASCVLKKKGTVAHFTAALLRACGPCGDGRARTTEKESNASNESNALVSGSAAAAAAADAALARRAAQAGFKAGTRDAPGVLFGLPAWLTRYVAFCVAFAAEEREALAEVLEARFAAETTETSDESKSASRLEAEAEAEGVHAGRLQSLAVTLDKVRHVLVNACGGEDKIATAPPPLAALDDAAVTARLAATRRRVPTPRARSVWTCRKIECLAPPVTRRSLPSTTSSWKRGARWRRWRRRCARSPTSRIRRWTRKSSRRQPRRRRTCVTSRRVRRRSSARFPFVRSSPRSCRWASSTAATPGRCAALRTGRSACGRFWSPGTPSSRSAPIACWKRTRVARRGFRDRTARYGGAR